MIVGLLGGLAIFIYGMKQMSEGLQKVAGKKLRRLLASLTGRPLRAVLVGTGVTALVQSSSATTVMTIGFVNAGLINLSQAIGVIIGANVGTTITAQLISFRLEEYAYHAIIIGVFAFLFARDRRKQYLGQCLLGFGLLFLGLGTMGDMMAPLRDSPVFAELMATFGTYPALGLVIGAVVTILVQSSTASFGIMIGLAGAGALDFQTAIPIILGTNIGTTVTAALSSAGANLTAKRTGAAHFLFNTLGSVIFVGLIYLIPDFTLWVETFISRLSLLAGQQPSLERMLANTHTLFNIVNALLWLPFMGVLKRGVMAVIPGEDMTIKRGLTYVDMRMTETPGVAMDQVDQEVVRMLEISQDMVDEAMEALIEGDRELADRVIEKEEIVNEIEEDLLEFLAGLSGNNLSEDDLRLRDYYISLVDAIESIADDADDLADLALHVEEHRLEFSGEAESTLKDLQKRLNELLKKSVVMIEKQDYKQVPDLIKAERDMDSWQLDYRRQHMERLKEGVCEPAAGIIYLEAIEDVEHLTDQLADMAHTMMEL
ncbi:phosphate:Na+ symporter [Halarsenatibacter silvermanii]|uniref:Phosphate:Na+ symporter n=2 Tax=Halarsenatibacter silvermanii TaxID=321763 RepID=A0A1G9GYC6_9FIRM|nr:Na/Pi cotransporter family protein [Halarsenatibacter silvermanii]SDL05666.1 phosphate:Na+ symporter [Halarsenatibacter silvermanii]